DLANQRVGVHRPSKHTAAFVEDSVAPLLERALGRADEDDVHVRAARHVTQAARGLERVVGVYVTQNERRALRRDASDEQRERNVHHQIAAPAQGVAEALCFGGGVTHENERLWLT